MNPLFLILSIGLLNLIGDTHGKVVTPDIYCNEKSLDVRVSKEGVEKVSLEKWSILPGCETREEQDAFFISLKLTKNLLPCGLTQIRNKITNELIFYHKVLVKETNGKEHLFKVSCFVNPNEFSKSNIVKRNVFPPEFVEPDYVEIIREVSGSAPVPELSVGVRQLGSLIGNEVTVSPGAPLTMEVYLDGASSSTYGILVSYMIVTDTTDKNETIIFNGCTQDRYVFENFQTENGDLLTAQFRAFKFPESNYLLFRGTVDVCLDKCQGIRCSSGELGYGRKKRSLANRADPNKIFEVSMMTFLKVIDQNLEEGKSEVSQNEFLHDKLPVRSFKDFKEEEIYVEETFSNEGEAPFAYYYPVTIGASNSFLLNKYLLLSLLAFLYLFKNYSS